MTRADIMNFLVVTLVAVLIWYLAAGETRVEREMSITTTFQVAEAGDWRIEPSQKTIDVTASGSQRAVRQAEKTLGNVVIQLAADKRTHPIDTADVLQDHQDVEATGITIESPDPASLEITIDRLESGAATVVPPEQTGIKFESFEIVPSQVMVQMTEIDRADFPAELTVEAVLDRSSIEALADGLEHTLPNVGVRLPNAESLSDLTITPPRVTATFRIQSRMRQVDLDNVRIQVLSPPEEDVYSVALDPTQIRDVSVTASREVIREIEDGDAVVLAVLHLKSTEKDREISSKRISGFVVVRKDGRSEDVSATVGGSDDLPIIGLTIAQRAQE